MRACALLLLPACVHCSRLVSLRLPPRHLHEGAAAVALEAQDASDAVDAVDSAVELDAVNVADSPSGDVTTA